MCMFENVGYYFRLNYIICPEQFYSNFFCCFRLNSTKFLHLNNVRQKITRKERKAEYRKQKTVTLISNILNNNTTDYLL